jgi:hypothetical protein
MIKSFRGQIAHGGEETIRLSTNKGLIGYRIKQLQIITTTPYATGNAEHVVKVYSTPGHTVDGVVNMDDPTFLAVAITNDSTSGYQWFTGQQIIFDNVVINQDIFITHAEVHGSTQACNYYLELEQIKLSVDEAAVATLKDMRGSN